jgi:RalA-binding protein 1
MRTQANAALVGIVFAPTLNVPAPLISMFVEEQAEIFGPAFDEAESPISVTEMIPASTASTDLRSPRKQMFSELPTPAYNQTTFQSFGSAMHNGGDTGMIPMNPSYGSYQMAPQGDGGYGSLNDALRSPGLYGAMGHVPQTPREAKSKRRESAMMYLNPVAEAPQKKTSMSRLRDEEGAKF